KGFADTALKRIQALFSSEKGFAGHLEQIGTWMNRLNNDIDELKRDLRRARGCGDPSGISQLSRQIEQLQLAKARISDALGKALDNALRRGFRVPAELLSRLGGILRGATTAPPKGGGPPSVLPGGFPIGDPLKDIIDIMNGNTPEFRPGIDVLVPTPWGFYIYTPSVEA